MLRSPGRGGKKTAMLDPMTRRNLASADYEPTDADLIELSHEAFAGIPEARAESLLRMRERIARRGAELLAELEGRLKLAGASR